MIGSASHYIFDTSLFVENMHDAICSDIFECCPIPDAARLGAANLHVNAAAHSLNLSAMRTLLTLPHSLTHLIHFNGSKKKKQYGVAITTDTPYISMRYALASTSTNKDYC